MAYGTTTVNEALLVYDYIARGSTELRVTECSTCKHIIVQTQAKNLPHSLRLQCIVESLYYFFLTIKPQ